MSIISELLETSAARVTVAPPSLIGEPDINAMIQAMYSRSHKSIAERLEELSSGEFDLQKIKDSLKHFYVNYNHQSIGDCGGITVYIENVSFLTAKAIQDNPLYNGQEASSRFIDFGQQPTPVFLTSQYKELYHHSMNLYNQSLSPISEVIATNASLPMSPKGLKAATFDVARGLLPLFCSTELSWAGSIRTFREHLHRLIYTHPYPMVRADAEVIRKALSKRWSDLFSDLSNVRVEPHDWFATRDQLSHVNHELFLTMQAKAIAKNFAVKQELPQNYRGLGTFYFNSAIDYGGYRDLQRHRASYIKSEDPLTIEKNTRRMHKFYQQILQQVKYMTFREHLNPLYPMPLLGHVVSYFMLADLQQWRYKLKLRSSPTVHPIVRGEMLKAYDTLTEELKHNNLELDLFVHTTEEDYNKRGEQDIIKREA